MEYIFLCPSAADIARTFWREHYLHTPVPGILHWNINETYLPSLAAFQHAATLRMLIIAQDQYGEVHGVIMGISPCIAYYDSNLRQLILSAFFATRCEYFLMPLHVVNPRTINQEVLTTYLLDTLLYECDQHFLNGLSPNQGTHYFDTIVFNAETESWRNTFYKDYNCGDPVDYVQFSAARYVSFYQKSFS